MSYMHYGRIGDIWKHLPLCNILVNEKPRYYIESNSAEPEYTLTHSPERDYGIYTFLDKGEKSDIIKNSVFYNTIMNYGDNMVSLNKYPGSPGLAMNILKDSAEKYIFCDIEEEPLNAIKNHSQKTGLADRVETYRGDSIKTIDSLIHNFSSSDFIHIDPYSISDANTEGKTFFDTFLVSVRKGIKSMLWYGYENSYQKKKLNGWMKEKAESAGIRPDNNVTLVEVYMSSIQEKDVIINPGVVGCGVMTGNLSQKSTDELDIFSDELTRIYQNTTVNGRYSGRLLKEKTVL